MFGGKSLLGGVVVLAFLFLSCSDDSGLEKGPLEPVKKPVLDIGDASSLVVVSSNGMNGGGRIASESSSNLYKITTSGSFEEVTFLNEDNTPIDSNKTQTTVRVDNIFDVSKNYLVLQGYFTAWDTLGNTQSYGALLVRKDDGSIYDFNTMDIGTGPIFEDENGNFYYGSSNTIMQVDVSNPDLLRKSVYLPSGQTTYSFGVDLNGNAIYVYNGIRVRKKNGGIYEINITENLPSPPWPTYGNYFLEGFWIGTNGKIYLESYDVGPVVSRSHFHTVSVDEQNTVVIDTVWSGPQWANQNAIGHRSSTDMLRINKDKSIFFVNPTRAAWEFFEDTNTLVEISLPFVERYDNIFYSDTHLYYRQDLDIYKISLSDYSYEIISLPQDDQFEIYTMNTGQNESIQLSALRFSDGKKIFAQIDSTGVFSIIDEELDKKAILLQRLN